MSIRRRMVETPHDEAENLQSGWGATGGGLGRSGAGRFYWHFKHRRALLEATLGRWEEETTEARISAARRISDPGRRLIRLGEEVFGEGPLDLGQTWKGSP